MSRLFSSLLLAAVALALLDTLVPRWLDAQWRARIDEGRIDTFADVVFRSLEQANQSVNASISRAHRRYEALPDVKPAGEIRVFVIGNSAALFAVAPKVLEERLARAYPRRTVRLMPLLIPDLGVLDENLLVRAAVAKQADLVVLFPNLKGLILGREVRTHFLRAVFGEAQEGPWSEVPGDWLRGVLLRHWQLFRHRDAVRELVLARLPLLSSRARERERMEEAFRAIEQAAAREDVDAILREYRERGMDRFVPAGLPRGEVPRQARVFQAMRHSAEQVRASGAMGVAIFLPVNPLFRDPRATRAHPEVRVHDPTLRKLSRVSLDLYRRAGFATVDQLDALPPTAFIDLVHANAEGMRIFTDKAADILVRALRALERREGRSLSEGSSRPR